MGWEKDGNQKSYLSWLLCQEKLSEEFGCERVFNKKVSSAMRTLAGLWLVDLTPKQAAP